MRVDVNHISSNQIELEKSSNGKAALQPSSAEASVEDRASLKNDSATVNSLAQKALAVPDIRQDKVNELKQQVQSGKYSVDPTAIAKAMRENGV